MPNTVKQAETAFGDPNPTKCTTCPASLVLANDLDLHDRDDGETESTPIQAHLETVTGTDGKPQRRIVLSKAPE